MKYIQEFRQPEIARQLADAIAQIADPDRHYRLMEFCGGHTHAIFRYGISDLLPANVEFIHGPGCPVCVLPISRIDQAIELVQTHQVILCTYADLIRVPASGQQSLLKLKAAGGDVRLLQSSQQALQIALDNPQRQVVFMAIGFETTTPATAVAIEQAQALKLQNFSVLCNHVLTPAAMKALLAAPEPLQVDGFLGPSHVSTIIGSQPYQAIAERYLKPIVIAGFEPLDVLQSVWMLLKQLNAGEHQVENQYSRAVTVAGNLKAQDWIARYFDVRDSFEWRGLGQIPDSALKLKAEYAQFNAEQRFHIPLRQTAEVKGCECPAILRGAKKPQDCRLLGKLCTPENPIGSCMVSSEGACAAYWRYRRSRT